MTAASAAARASLDAADKLPVGAGRADLFVFAKRDGGRTFAGGAAEYQHRIRSNLSAFGRAWVGGDWDGREARLAGEATAGIRLSW